MKGFTAFLAVCLLLMAPHIVHADVIIEPENDFYKQHESQIEYLGRRFYANGGGGNVSVKSEPGSKNEVAKLQNGEETYIQYSCFYDGDYWGYALDFGWIKMDQLLVIYDYITFEEDHPGEFYSYEGDYDEIKRAGAVVVWPWPGSDAPLWTFEYLDTENFSVSHAYRDEQGREWGFVTYLYGHQNVWVCLSDPINQNIPVFNPEPEPMLWVSDTEHIEIEKSVNPITVLVIVLVAALAIGTIILLRVFWKPEIRKEKTFNG